jgi:multidrug efflux pump subunit AcrB
LGLGKRLSGLGGVQSLVYHFKEQRPALRIELDPARLSLLGVSVKETAEEIGYPCEAP